MKILVLNCGSSSVKFQFIQMDNEKVLAKGIVEKIGAVDAIVKYEAEGKGKLKEIMEVKDHKKAVDLVISSLLHPDYGVISDKSEISGIGHRLVHGAEFFTQSVLISDEVCETMRQCIRFAPLHNPHNLKGVEVCAELLPNIKQVGVFDTTFHQQMKEDAYIYGLPYELYQNLGIRRYGFHGTSFRYVTQEVARILDRPVEDLKMVICHLGNGSSIAAVKGGISIDTSMGFTPLEGVIMGTRCGSIDPAIITYLIEDEKMSAAEVYRLMNSKSGFLGVSGVSNDLREVEDEAIKGHKRCQLALDIFAHTIKKYIGAYAALLNGIDVLAFTAGIGEKSFIVRGLVCRNMEYLGIEFDEEENDKNGLFISKGKTKVMVIPTNEELMIARDTVDILFKSQKEVAAGV